MEHRATMPAQRPLLDGFTPYPPEFVKRYRTLGYWEDRSLATFFRKTCARFAERTALVAGDERVSYQQLIQRAERLALHLLALGVQPRDRIILQLPNSLEFAYLYVALQLVGAIPIMALPAHGKAEINQFAHLGEAVGYAIPERSKDFEFVRLAREVQQQNSQLRFVFVVGEAMLPGSISLTDLLQREGELAPECLDTIAIDPLDPAVLLSKGTTGIPKLIPRTHNDYLYNSKAAAGITDVQADDTLLVVLPMAHNFPLACPGIQGFLMHGACCILTSSHRPSELFSLIQQEHITHLELTPTLLTRLINDPSFPRYDLSSLRVLNAGGQKLHPEIKQRTELLLPGCTVQEVFGMAEGLLCYVRLTSTSQVRYETVGRPMSLGDEIKLVDEEGNEVPEGEVGELLVRGPYTLRGYFRAPEQNIQGFTPDGFYRTGDLVRRGTHGNYIVEGRKKDLINCGKE